MTTSFSTSGAAPDRIVHPISRMHNVKPGETLASLSQAYGISTDQLIRMNSHAIGRDGIIHQGMRLHVGLQ